jgi:hypothetical protein
MSQKRIDSPSNDGAHLVAPLLARIDWLLAQIAAKDERIDELLAQVKALNARIAELEAKRGGPPQVRRHDRGREANATGIISRGLPIMHARLADRNRADARHDLAFREVAVAHKALAPVRDLEIGMLSEKIRDLGLYGLSQQAARALSQDFGALVVKGSWLNQLEHVIV